MSHTASGRIALVLENMRSLLAVSATFQTLRNAANATDAKVGIHLVSLPEPVDGHVYTLEELQAYRPFALIDFPDDGESFNSSRIAETAYQDSGRLVMMLEAEVPDALAKRPADAKIWFLNQVGAILTEMMAYSGDAGYLTVHTFRILRGPERSRDDVLSAEGDFFQVLLEIEWGV